MDLIAALRDALGEKGVLTHAADRAPYEADWRHLFNHKALCVVLPAATEQVAAVVKICREAGAKIVPQGGNTGLVAGGVPSAAGNQVILNLSQMRRIRSIDTLGDTITVEAGATLAAVQDAAADVGRLFPVSIGAEGTAQIGGAISTNAGGMQVLSYGSMRAQVLGLEVVLPDGRIWNGLRALRKDNTGFDLKQVFIGAEGTLGIVAAACLTLHPAVIARATALAGTGSAADALKLFQALRARAGAAFTLCEFMTHQAAQLGTQGPLPFEAGAYVLIELSAHDAGENVAAILEGVLADALKESIISDAVVVKSEGERSKLLALREAVPESELREGGAVKHDIAVPLGAIPDMLDAVESLMAAKYPDCRISVFGHLGDGNLHINIRPPAGKTLVDLADRRTAITQDIENSAVALGGSFSAEHGIGQMRLSGMAAHKSAEELDLMRAVKQAIDPDGLFNPGKVIPMKDEAK